MALKRITSLAGLALCAATCFGDVDLNGVWEFRFEEDRAAADVADPAFTATDRISVPGCYDMMPKWLCKRGTGFIASSKIKFTKAAGEVYPLADDFKKNSEGCQCMEKALAALKAKCRPFGTNDEETYNCGEGAVVLDKLHPELVKKLAEYVAARADNPKKDKIVVASAYVKRVLAKYGKLNVVTLEELAASCL